MGLRFRIVHRPYSFDGHDSLDTLVRDQDIQFLSYITTTQRYSRGLAPYRGFHVVRDPRDIVVSAYFSHLKSLESRTWKELGVIRSRLRNLSKDDGLAFELEYLEPQFQEMAEWNYDQKHILELRLEDLSSDPVRHFMYIFQFVKMVDDEERTVLLQTMRNIRLRMNRLNYRGRRFMPGRFPVFPVPLRPVDNVPPGTIESIVRHYSFSRLSGGRTKGQEDVGSHYRKGVHGDWKNHFNRDHIRTFKNRYNNLLVMLGYEKDADW